MRSYFATLVLLALMPTMKLPAAPAPDPSAILDIGPPPKGTTAAEHCKDVIYRMTNPRGYIWHAGIQPEVGKLPSISRLKDAHPWLAENIRVAAEQDGRRLRVTFRAGTRAEQVVIINALLREYLRWAVTDRIKIIEDILGWEVDRIPELEKRIESGQHLDSVELYRKQIEDLRKIQIPARRAEIARVKQIAVVKWAK